MSEIFQEPMLIDDNNINDIFERKIEVGAVIQFNLLQRLIEEFIKRQKSLNDKVNNLEIKINSLSINPFNPDMIEEKDEFKSDINYDTEKENSLIDKEDDNSNNLESNEEKKDTIENEPKENLAENNGTNDNINLEEPENKNEMNNNNINDNNNANINNNTNNNANIKKKINKNNKNVKSNNTNINNKYRILSSRMDRCEKILNELTKSIYNINENNKNYDLEKMSNDSKRYDGKIKNIEKEIFEMNQKIKDINLLQINFGDIDKEEDENEETKNKNAEIFKAFSKKIELVENRAKQSEEDIFKMKHDMKDINNLVLANKKNYAEFMAETNKNFNAIKKLINSEVNALKNLIIEKNEKTKKDLKDNFNKEIQNIQKIIAELKISNMNNSENIIDSNLINSKINEKINKLTLDIKDIINQNSSDTEQYIKTIINNLGIDNIKKELLNIHQILKEKLIKSDLEYIDNKLREIENRLITETLRIETMEKDVSTCNGTCSRCVKMIEYLSGRVIENTQKGKDQEKNEMLKGLLTFNEKEIKSFVNKNEFSYEIKNIYKKINEVLDTENENYKYMQHLEKRLNIIVTQSDLKTMEQCLLNMLEELKISFARKYMEKADILRSIKLLEIQIKSIYDSNPSLIKEADNWLLAKKPMNNYLCASCEAYIGDLKNKNIYLPWNKIPPHESKKYRMGNGFSRMLELVNTDLMKNAEKINDKLVIRIDDKKNNFDTISPLPRIGSQINLKKWNKQSNTFYAVKNDSFEKRLNNSADGSEQNISETINNKDKTNNYQEIKNSRKNLNNLGEVIPQTSSDKDSKTPKLLKIYKKIKKDT